MGICQQDSKGNNCDLQKMRINTSQNEIETKKSESNTTVLLCDIVLLYGNEFCTISRQMKNNIEGTKRILGIFQTNHYGETGNKIKGYLYLEKHC